MKVKQTKEVKLNKTKLNRVGKEKRTISFLFGNPVRLSQVTEGVTTTINKLKVFIYFTVPCVCFLHFVYVYVKTNYPKYFYLTIWRKMNTFNYYSFLLRLFK